MKSLNVRKKMTREGINAICGAALVIAVVATFALAIWLLTVLRITGLQVG